MAELIFGVCFIGVSYCIVQFLKKHETKPEDRNKYPVTGYDANMAARIGEETAKALHRIQQEDKNK